MFWVASFPSFQNGQAQQMQRMSGLENSEGLQMNLGLVLKVNNNRTKLDGSVPLSDDLDKFHFRQAASQLILNVMKLDSSIKVSNVLKSSGTTFAHVLLMCAYHAYRGAFVSCLLFSLQILEFGHRSSDNDNIFSKCEDTCEQACKSFHHLASCTISDCPLYHF